MSGCIGNNRGGSKLRVERKRERKRESAREFLNRQWQGS